MGAYNRIDPVDEAHAVTYSQSAHLPASGRHTYAHHFRDALVSLKLKVPILI